MLHVLIVVGSSRSIIHAYVEIVVHHLSSSTMPGFTCTTSSLALLAAVLSANLRSSSAFSLRLVVVPSQSYQVATRPTPTCLFASYLDSLDSKALAEVDAAMKAMPAEERKEKIGKLIEDDEWLGLAVEMTEAVRSAIVQDVKKKQKAVADGVKGKTTEFIGKDEYKVGDIAKTLDAKVKQEIANLRGKEECESILRHLSCTRLQI